MTFRIDSVEKGDWGWLINLKGLEGKGVYGRLVTALDGHGLYVIDEDDIKLGADSPKVGKRAPPGCSVEDCIINGMAIECHLRLVRRRTSAIYPCASPPAFAGKRVFPRIRVFRRAVSLRAEVICRAEFDLPLGP